MNRFTSREFATNITLNRTLIIPCGSYEQHGNHMVLDTDTIIAEVLSKLVGMELKIICLPAIPFGVSEVHMSFNGTVTISPGTYYALIKDIICSLEKESISNIIFVNGHGGNTRILKEIMNEYNCKYNFELFNWWEFVETSIFNDSEMCSHAGAQELSVLGSIDLELVRTDQVENQKHNKYIRGKFSDLKELTLNGVMGKAEGYDFEKGSKIIDICICHLKEIILSKVGRNDY